MTDHILHLVIFAIAMLVAAKVVPGIHVRSFGSALIFAFMFAVVDKLLYGLLVFLSFPFVLLSLGLFLLVINALLFRIANRLSPGILSVAGGVTFNASTTFNVELNGTTAGTQYDRLSATGNVSPQLITSELLRQLERLIA